MAKKKTVQTIVHIFEILFYLWVVAVIIWLAVLSYQKDTKKTADDAQAKKASNTRLDLKLSLITLGIGILLIITMFATKTWPLMS